MEENKTPRPINPINRPAPAAGSRVVKPVSPPPPQKPAQPARPNLPPKGTTTPPPLKPPVGQPGAGNPATKRVAVQQPRPTSQTASKGVPSAPKPKAKEPVSESRFSKAEMPIRASEKFTVDEELDESRLRPTGLSLSIKYAIFTALIVAIALCLLVFFAQQAVQKEVDYEINKAGIRLVKVLSALDMSYWKEIAQRGEGSIDPLSLLDIKSAEGDKRQVTEPTILNLVIVEKRDKEEIPLCGMNTKAGQITLRDYRDLLITDENIDIKEGKYFESLTSRMVRTRMFTKEIRDKDRLVQGKVILFLSATQIDEVLNKLLIAFLFPALISVMIGGVVGFVMAKHITKPVKDLMYDMQVVSGGDLDHQSSVKTSDEVGVLAKTFNIMTKSLKVAHQKEVETKALERELNIAREIQYNLLPKEIPALAGYDISAHYKPCYEVSGDYYDLIQIDDNNLGVIVADISGKGIPASMIMTMTRSLVRIESEHNLSPANILTKVNRILARDVRRGMFVTALYYILNIPTGTIKVASAGHNPLLVWRSAQRKYELIHPNGLALGFDRGPMFEKLVQEQTLQLNAQDRLVSYTDGVTEAMNAKTEEFGATRFYNIATQSDKQESSQFINVVMKALQDYKGNAPQHDDITIVSIRRT
ncbi:MAG: SpoIIE family protein phosphatase [Planctomycetes bacterium]|nr:SpoIIE family protein phosphatase [Planctomycetota bacterium]